jgi:hypothetical protein
VCAGLTWRLQDEPLGATRRLTSADINSAMALLTETTPTADTAVNIGDRVIVSGRFSGTLRYWGTVQFSHGLWAGVELDEPGLVSSWLCLLGSL